MTISDKLASLNQEFSDSFIYQEAITHRSAASRHNERLEYLGDAVLGMVIAEYLFLHYPQLEEGDLSRLRSYLVRKETLAKLANENQLGNDIILGPGELKSGGFRRASILADTMEAIIGAVYVELTFDKAKEFILDLYASRLSNMPSVDTLKDPKSRLQELLQSRNHPLPQYRLKNAEEALKSGEFHSECDIPSLMITETGTGSSKRKAEQDAASRAYATVIEKLS